MASTKSNFDFLNHQRIIGSGTYGTVYQTIWRGKKVAIKRIELHKLFNDQEKEALQNLLHPNIVKLIHIENDKNFR